MSTNILLVIPVFNEQEHLPTVLKKARQYVGRILVVDDGSTDQTPSLLAGADDVAVIRHKRNYGYGRSLVDAFRFAAQERFDWLITMDCDEQHEPEAIPEFLAAITTQDADIISGSRYLRSTSADDLPPPQRRAINMRITAIINERLGLGITDAFCGFKAYRVASLAALEITDDGYAMPLQLWVQSARAGLRIRELPVRLVYNDPNRHFGGALDDPDVRFNHYMRVFETELAAPADSVCCSAASTPESIHDESTCCSSRDHGCLWS